MPYAPPGELSSVPAGAAEIQFIDPTHAIWKREGRSTRIEHFQARSCGFVARADETYLMLARRRDGLPRSASALVRTVNQGQVGLNLECLDCADVRHGMTGHLRHTEVEALSIVCAPHCALKSSAELALLNLPYANRLRAIARDPDEALTDIALIPIAPGYSWRSDQQDPPLQAESGLPNNRLGAATVYGSNYFGYRYASVPGYHLLLGQSKDGFPRWWSAQYLEGPCTVGDTDRGLCFVLNRGAGRFAEPVQRRASTVADFIYRFIIRESLPYLEMGQDSFARPPLAPAPLFILLETPPGLNRPVTASSGIIVVRAPNYELRGHVRNTTTTTIALGAGWYVTEVRQFECIDCNQRGIAGNAEAAEALLRSALQAFRTVTYYSIDSYAAPQHEFQSAAGTRHLYSRDVMNRQGDEISYRRYRPYHSEGEPLPEQPGPEVPETLQYFPLSDD